MFLSLRHYLFLFVIIFCYRTAVFAGAYEISTMPDSLKVNAGAVVRVSHSNINIPDTHHAFLSEEKVISILDQSKENLALIRIDYRSGETIINLDASVYDASGRIVYHLKNADIVDMSATTYELTTSQRCKLINLKKTNLPYTIKVSYIKEIAGTFSLPPWIPSLSTGVSVETADLRVSYSKNTEPLFKSEGIGAPVDSSNSLFWKITGVAAVKKEDYSPSPLSLLPHVYLMIKSFELYGVQGNAGSWNGIGKFFNKLDEGRDIIKHVDDDQLKKILSSTNDTLNKIKLLYKYLQENIRYVNIAIDIGGWQTQEASVTLKEKYGDCKALVTVMRALLKKIGVQSYACLVYGGDDPPVTYSDFPCPLFNHVILCIPMTKDTIWLECTANTYPFNYLGQFTSGRKALLIFNDGASLIETPDYDEHINIRSTVAHIKLNENTSLITATVNLSGKIHEPLLSVADKKDDAATRQLILACANLRNTSLTSYSINTPNSDIPCISVKLELNNQRSIHKTDTRIFVRTNIFEPMNSIPEKDSGRSQPVRIDAGFTQSDTLVYYLPAGYSPENFKPQDLKEYSSLFGNTNCTIRYIAETGELTVIRKFCLKQATYPANQYQPLRDFLLKATKICCPELVLKKT